MGNDGGAAGGAAAISDEVLLARTKLYLLITMVVGIPFACAGLGVLMLLTVPLAHVIAGKHTDLTVSLSFSLNAALAATTAVTGAGFAIQTRSARHHKARARELEKKVKSQDEDPASAEDRVVPGDGEADNV